MRLQLGSITNDKLRKCQRLNRVKQKQQQKKKKLHAICFPHCQHVVNSVINHMHSRQTASTYDHCAIFSLLSLIFLSLFLVFPADNRRRTISACFGVRVCMFMCLCHSMYQIAVHSSRYIFQTNHQFLCYISFKM